MASSSEVVRLYRHILKLAQRYPSVKRNSIIRDIKLEFHENKALTDSQKIREQIASARAGIQELSMYASLNANATNWQVECGRQVSPMSSNSTGGMSNSSSGTKVVGSNTRQDS